MEKSEIAKVLMSEIRYYTTRVETLQKRGETINKNIVNDVSTSKIIIEICGQHPNSLQKALGIISTELKIDNQQIQKHILGALSWCSKNGEVFR
jgi:hypothetical protein